MEDLIHMESMKKVSEIVCKLLGDALSQLKSNYLIIQQNHKQQSMKTDKQSAELFETVVHKRPYKKLTEKMKKDLKRLVQSEEFSRNQACRQLKIAPSTGKKYLQQVLPLAARRRHRLTRSPIQAQLQSVAPSEAQEAPHDVEEHIEHSTLIQQSSITFWVPIPSETVIFYWH